MKSEGKYIDIYKYLYVYTQFVWVCVCWLRMWCKKYRTMHLQLRLMILSYVIVIYLYVNYIHSQLRYILVSALYSQTCYILFVHDKLPQNSCPSLNLSTMPWYTTSYRHWCSNCWVFFSFYSCELEKKEIEQLFSCVFYSLIGLRIGQQFCEIHFTINDVPTFFFHRSFCQELKTNLVFSFSNYYFFFLQNYLQLHYCTFIAFDWPHWPHWQHWQTQI